MKTQALAYRDLLGKPFAWGARGPDSFDCLGVVYEVLSRAGIAVPFEVEGYGADARAAEKSFRASEDRAPGWVLVGHRAGSATRIGDVIYCSARDDDHHVSVVVSDRIPRIALTISARRRVHAVRAAELRNVIAVYRVAGAA